MSRTISANEANQTQLEALLGLSPEETALVVEMRPFATAKDFHRALPLRVAQQKPGLELPKIDINCADARQLARSADISVDLARSIVANRPYYSMIELGRILGGNIYAFERLTECFAIDEFSYLDKTTGRAIQLLPDMSRLLVRFRESQTESAADLAESTHLTAISERRRGDRYQAFFVSEEESGAHTIANLRVRTDVELAVPAFRDRNESFRYLDPNYCIVQFQQNVSPAQEMALIASLGLKIHEQHRSSGLLTLLIPSGDEDPGAVMRVVAALNEEPIVRFSEPAFLGMEDLESVPQKADFSLSPANQETTTALDAESAPAVWNLALVRALDARKYGTGSQDVIIAVIDTGVERDHPAISDAVLQRPLGESWNFADSLDPDPTDYDGHGTFIAGLLVGNGLFNVQGICPGCRILPLKVPLTGASLSYARRRDAILYALNYVTDQQRLIINISWKTTGDVALIRDAIISAVRRNAVVVCSAGNWPNRSNEEHYPSDYACAISVGGVDPSGQRAIYSFYSQAVDLAAPGGSGPDPFGQNIVSAARGGTTTVDFGTSFAAPHVSGAAALLLSRHPVLSVEELRVVMENSAAPVFDSGLGHGLLDVAAAHSIALSIDGSGNARAPEHGPTESPGLAAINYDDLDTLALKFGLASLTARLLIARRPFARQEDIRGTLGLSDDQYDAIASYQAYEHRPAESPGLAAINYDDLDTLALKFGLASLTARLLIARRPFARQEDIRETLGLSVDQYDAIASYQAYEHRPAESPGLAAINYDDLDTLVLKFDLASLTARLLIARRPFARQEDIRGTLGLSDYQYDAIASYQA